MLIQSEHYGILSIVCQTESMTIFCSDFHLCIRHSWIHSENDTGPNYIIWGGERGEEIMLINVLLSNGSSNIYIYVYGGNLTLSYSHPISLCQIPTWWECDWWEYAG